MQPLFTTLLNLNTSFGIQKICSSIVKEGCRVTPPLIINTPISALSDNSQQLQTQATWRRTNRPQKRQLGTPKTTPNTPDFMIKTAVPRPTKKTSMTTKCKRVPKGLFYENMYIRNMRSCTIVNRL